MAFLKELQNRNVVRVALAYLAAAWLLVQIIETLSAFFDVPTIIGRAIVIVLAIGLFLVVVLAWTFEWTPDGIVRDTGSSATRARRDHRRFDRLVMIVLVIAVGVFAVDKFVLDPVRDAKRESEIASQVRSDALLEQYAERSIVVLPFVNMSDDQQNEYFSDGITEELLNLLARIPDLRVISRTSSFALKDQPFTTSEVAAKLNVSHILEGSVRKAGPVVRVTAQLIDARTDTHVWSDTYDREFALTEILDVQDEVAQLVVRALKLNLPARTGEAVDPVAYDNALKAEYLMNLYDPEKVAQIDELIDEGLEADPDYARLLWARSRLLGQKRFWKLITREEAERAKARLTERLQVLDPDSPMWISRAADEAYRAHDWRKAADLVRELYEAAPTDPFHIENISRAARALGQFDASIALSRYLVNRDPLNGRYYFRLGLAYNRAGRFEEGIPVFEQAALLESGQLDPYAPLGDAYLHTGQPQKALETFKRVRNEQFRNLGLLQAYWDLGDLENYEALRAKIWPELGWDMRAAISAWTGDADAAFEYLEIGYRDARDILAEQLFYETSMTRLRDDPRWREMMERLGTTPEDLAKYDLKLDLEHL